MSPPSLCARAGHTSISAAMTTQLSRHPCAPGPDTSLYNAVLFLYPPSLCARAGRLRASGRRGGVPAIPVRPGRTLSDLLLCEIGGPFRVG